MSQNDAARSAQTQNSIMVCRVSLPEQLQTSARKKVFSAKTIRPYFTPFTDTTFQGRNQQEDYGFRKIKLKA
jgi:hypothetical protein